MAKIMNKEKYIPRIIDAAVERYLATMGAVCIEGAQLCHGSGGAGATTKQQ